VADVKEAHRGANGQVLGDQAAAGARAPGDGSVSLGCKAGVSQPPKSTILAFSARCVAFRAVFISGEAMGEAGVVIGVSFNVAIRPVYVRSLPAPGWTAVPAW
jgi:hypothetical protein